ncbi:MAG: phosphocarrier protein HPr [Gammaproteobacteria bacterium RIFCSPLOWO2_02_FULL_47_50]|jgi:phosphocarrier protein|nr:MAG: phosphocarrier protein HPr [Gammaproteobacteria bacterium RIFCSPLOWO2_02_47_7]OGT66280.1 MAG: phosphocarrier protein HPr [Gammaproteobacteria bacterium RIFCSPLOWO2_01_FULL_47_190]OGT75516.1 MAG: phosphocarrier protein HPr [Gammaproteobacteria bacterium RIFCSPLOWO2_12_47_11]OGT79112.1 MAG: phosphocarrier protein HPr [Gammaproteobacteria bacterium RIFCSPLOWO2_02_FULL_47_50]OGT83969.1 MAG: phosphocarrier protein HPr [Gammaproteobacteria bacterium RIFCSPLOWO2_12_FULL_47_76]
MAKRTVIVINKLGLHARAAARFVQAASGFNCDIQVKHGNREVNGKSIMGMMMLAAGKGAVIDILASGKDENTALDQLEELILNRFGESE